MALSKDFHVWNEEKKAVENNYREGSLDWLLAETVKACLKEAEAEDVTPEMLFDDNKVRHTAMIRGYLIFSFYNLLKGKLGLDVSEARVAGNMFCRGRNTTLYFIEKDEDAKDGNYITVRDSWFGRRVKKHIEDFLVKSQGMFW